MRLLSEITKHILATEQAAAWGVLCRYAAVPSAVASVAERRVLSYRVIKVEVGVRSNLRFDDERQKGHGATCWYCVHIRPLTRRGRGGSRRRQADAKEIYQLTGNAYIANPAYLF